MPAKNYFDITSKIPAIINVIFRKIFSYRANNNDVLWL